MKQGRRMSRRRREVLEFYDGLGEPETISLSDRVPEAPPPQLSSCTESPQATVWFGSVEQAGSRHAIWAFVEELDQFALLGKGLRWRWAAAFEEEIIRDDGVAAIRMEAPEGFPVYSPNVPDPLEPESKTPLYEKWPFVEIGAETDLLRFIQGLVPSGIPEQIRQEVCQELAVGLLSGDLDSGTAKDAARKLTSKAFGEERFTISLDAPFYNSHHRTKRDYIAAAPTEGADAV